MVGSKEMGRVVRGGFGRRGGEGMRRLEVGENRKGEKYSEGQRGRNSWYEVERLGRLMRIEREGSILSSMTKSKEGSRDGEGQRKSKEEETLQKDEVVRQREKKGSILRSSMTRSNQGRRNGEELRSTEGGQWLVKEEVVRQRRRK